MIDSVVLQTRQGIENNVEEDKIYNYRILINMIERYVVGCINDGYGFVTSTGV